MLQDLPAEMQQAVFSHLDLPSVRALRRVSQAVRALIGSRDFQKARHSVRNSSRLTRLQPAPWRRTYISEQHASGCPNFRPTSAHQPFGRGHGRDGLLFDTGVAGAQPGGAPVAGGEEEAGLRDRLCRGRRARDRAGGTQPPASAAAAAAATASALRRHSCTRARLRARFRERLRERVNERLDERLGVRARSRPLEQRVQCRRLQPELELEPR